MNIPDNAPIFRKLYAFMVIIHRSIHNMPREHRYALGTEIAKICWNCLDLVVVSCYAQKNDKSKKIAELSSEFDRLNLRIRVLQELNVISVGQFAHWQENYLLEIGKEIGGWLSWARRLGGG